MLTVILRLLKPSKGSTWLCQVARTAEHIFNWGGATEKFCMTTPSTLAINATNAPFHMQTRLGKDSYHQHIQSLNHLKKHHLYRCTVLRFYIS